MSDDAGTAINSSRIGFDNAARPLIVCIHGGGCNAGYFDLPGYSFCALAQARGYPLLLIDRPGHGRSVRMGGGFTASARAILEHIHVTIRLRQNRRWYLVGHSIGAAIAIIIAGEMRSAGLCGVAISGIGAHPMPTAIAWGGAGTIDSDVAGDLLFGPPGSFSWRAPGALRGVAEPWDAEEVTETLNDWPARFAGSAQGVSVPVHFRLAEGERIWRTGTGEVARLAGAFTHVPWIDAALLPEGGHLYELHLRGHELMTDQLDFFDRLT